MLSAQADEIVLRPDTSEFVWTVVTSTMLAALIFVIVGSIIWMWRTTARRRELEEL